MRQQGRGEGGKDWQAVTSFIVIHPDYQNVHKNTAYGPKVIFPEAIWEFLFYKQLCIGKLIENAKSRAFFKKGIASNVVTEKTDTLAENMTVLQLTSLRNAY